MITLNGTVMALLYLDQSAQRIDPLTNDQSTHETTPHVDHAGSLLPLSRRGDKELYPRPRSGPGGPCLSPPLQTQLILHHLSSGQKLHSTSTKEKMEKKVYSFVMLKVTITAKIQYIAVLTLSANASQHLIELPYRPVQGDTRKHTLEAGLARNIGLWEEGMIEP